MESDKWDTGIQDKKPNVVGNPDRKAWTTDPEPKDVWSTIVNYWRETHTKKKKQVLITSVDELIESFGEPDDNSYKDIMASYDIMSDLTWQ